jgi:hypothetical protein
VIVLCLDENLLAQSLVWSERYGGQLNEGGYGCVVTTDQACVLVGSTFSYGSGDFDVYLVKVDSLGDTLWTQTFGGPSAEYGYDIQSTSDNGFIITGSTRSFGAGGRDLYLIRTDEFGNQLWMKAYGGPLSEEGFSVRETSDGGFIVCGTENSFGGGSADLYLLRLGQNGDSLWSRSYGGALGESGAAVRQTGDGGFIAVGSTGSYGEGYSNVFVVRTDSSGDSLWIAVHGGAKADFGYSIEETLDNGYVIVGTTASSGAGFSDACLTKIYGDGTLQWEETYGGTMDEQAYSVTPTLDGGYVLAGTTQSYGSGKLDIYLVKTDPSGFPVWTNAYGGADSDYARGVISDPSGKHLFVVGHSYSLSAGGLDLFLLKVQSDAPTPVEDQLPGSLPEDYLLSQNYPNPFNLSTQIEFTLPRRSEVSLAIFNILGQQVRQWNPGSLAAGKHSFTWDGLGRNGSELATGVYLYRLTAGTSIQTRKMVLIK